MKTFILLIFSAFCLSSYCQDDIQIISERRVIVEVTVNGMQAFMLLDTGSTLNLINEKELKSFGIKKSFYIGEMSSMHSESAIYSLKNCKLKIGNSEYMQFGCSNLSNAVNGIYEDTGIEISGILGTPAIKELGMIIDLSRGIVTIKNKASNALVNK